jgi:hypothetical protein
MDIRTRKATGFVGSLAQIALAVAALLASGAVVQADVFLQADEPYPMGAEVFTVDPETTASPNARGLATGRELRQTFQVAATFDVKKIIVSLAAINATNGGLDIRFYEVPDVNAGGIGDPPAGTVVHTFTLAPSLVPATSALGRLGISLTGDDIFSLPQRNTGTEGYAIELRQLDTGVQTGTFRHTNDATDHYTAGRIYVETGNNTGATRDFGVSISSIESTLMLGDTDGNGVVEAADLTPIRMNYRLSGLSRTQGDLTGDTMATFADFRQWKLAYLDTVAGGGSLAGLDLSFLSSVPEPSSLLISLVGLLGFWKYRGARRAA